MLTYEISRNSLILILDDSDNFEFWVQFLHIHPGTVIKILVGMCWPSLRYTDLPSACTGNATEERKVLHTTS